MHEARGFGAEIYVRDAEFLPQGGVQPLKNPCALADRAVVTKHKVGGHRIHLRGYLPYVDVVHIHNFGRFASNCGDDLTQVYVFGRGLKQDIDGVTHQLPTPYENHGPYEYAQNRVDRKPSGQVYNNCAHNHAHRGSCISQHMQKGATDIQIFLAHAKEQARARQINDQPYQCDDKHPHFLNGDRMDEPVNGLVENENDDHQEGDSIEERGENLDAVEAETASGAGGNGGEDYGNEADHQRKEMRQHVAGIAHQRKAARENAADYLDNHRAAGKRHRQCQALALNGSVCVPVAGFFFVLVEML